VPASTSPTPACMLISGATCMTLRRTPYRGRPRMFSRQVAELRHLLVRPRH
jgi:hypothetical protein